MKISLTEMFCEILTGIIVLLIIVGWLCWFDVISIKSIWEVVKSNIKLEIVIVFLVCTYFIGTLFDVIGLVFDNIFDKLISPEVPSDKDISNFFKNTSVHVLSYRDNIWAYYFCYRNMFILSIPACIGLCGLILAAKKISLVIICIIITVLIDIAILNSMRTLLRLYYKITKSYSL
jgi:hypothetical protein